MKLYKKIFLILVVFFKTETLFSENDLFNVNNIELEKKDNISNNKLTDQAIKRGFNQLKTKILLKEDSNKISDLKFSSVKRLVKYYQITSISGEKKREKLLNFSVTFDKNKIHDLFLSRGISYAEISDKELYILPILIKEDDISIFNNNFFYENWNKVYQNDLIEFVLPLENIETIKKINDHKKDLIKINLTDLFEEFLDKNLALVIIEDNNTSKKKIYIKSILSGKRISKNLDFNNQKMVTDNLDEKIISLVKMELINLVKSKNLIDVGTPLFLNVRLNINKKNNLVKLNSKIKKIDSIEKIYVQEFNKDFMNLRIKYFGKLEKIRIQLKKENIDLQLTNDEWVIKAL